MQGINIFPVFIFKFNIIPFIVFTEIINKEFSGKAIISRFKGLGEMPPLQLKETTMSPKTRKLLKVTIPKRNILEADQRRLVDELVNTLMGKKPELRFKYIQDNANLVNNFDI